MLVANVDNVKDFMAQLLKKDMFNEFQVRDLSITTFVNFEVHGKLNRNFYDSQEDFEDLERYYCLWAEIQPFAFEIVKGSKLPKNIKIVFSASEELIAIVNDKASALFINIGFENSILTITTGSSQKDFTLDKSVEFMWDEWVNQFFARKGISLLEAEYEK